MISKYKYISIFLCAFIFYSCVDESFPDYLEEIEDEYIEGDAISLNITLDLMGGTRAGVYSEVNLQKMENYVDPSKFRVLFFDQNDQFLFESKSRWVRIQQANDGSNYLSWKVSVPFFSYGNDTEYEWDWDIIRRKLTTESFKIAILVNRPDNEWYPGFKDLRENDPARWFDNTGPHWVRRNSIAYNILCDSLQKYNLTEQLAKVKARFGEPDQKNVFDIHHSQEDPIYYGKSWTSNYEFGAYDCIMDGYSISPGSNAPKTPPYMSSTSSWVDWTGTGPDPRFANRPTVLPSEDHPIPMYGIQRYERIDSIDWLRGTTFKLDRKIANGDSVDDDPLFLLRSVARLDLIIPSGYYVDYCNIWYPNPYARCEPMNNWDPTNQIWSEIHEDVENGIKDGFHYYRDGNGKVQTYCDEASLVRFGPLTMPGIVYQKEATPYTVNKREFQKKLIFLYGAWFNAPTSQLVRNNEGKIEYDRGWDFGLSYLKNDHWIKQGGYTTKDDLYEDLVKPYVDKGIYPPQVLNPATQRNTTINVSNNQIFTEPDGSTHIVVYIGERNTQDPSQLFNIYSESSGHPTIMYWDIGIKTTQNGVATRYAIPIVDYGNNYGMGVPANATWSGNIFDDDGKYDNKVGYNGCGLENDYKNGKMTATGWDTPGPLPIIRNHIYRLTLRRTNWTPGQGKPVNPNSAPEFSVSSQVLRTKNVNFKVSSARDKGPASKADNAKSIVRK